MKIWLCLPFVLLMTRAFAQSDELTLEKELYDLPNVSFKKVSAPGDKYLRYDLLIRQPLDHQHPEKGYFEQRATLLHKGFDRPSVIETQGYWLPRGTSEVEKFLDANDINVEYRFYGKSLPDPIPWEYLTIEQATADLHAINQLFRNIYHGKWVSTGISKGGETTLYYKFFYPADVDLSLPYVAPLDNSFEDQRLYHFFDTIGTADCRQRLFKLQVYLLEHEQEAIEKMKWFALGAHAHFTYTGSIGKSFEYSVLEFPFAFWQYHGDCAGIPLGQPLDSCLSYLMKISDITAFSDEGIKEFEAHYYQAATQSGYYGYQVAPFKKYLHYLDPNGPDPSATFPPKSAPAKAFDPTLNARVADWLARDGNNIIYIYGGIDAWTAAGIVPTDKVNSKRFVVPGATHSTARVEHMDAEMREQYVNAVKTLAGLDVLTTK